MTEEQKIIAGLMKLLEWEKPGTVAASYKATTPFIIYRVNDNGENWAEDRFTLWGADNRYSMGRFPTLAAAQAAAEADYRARIGAALNLGPVVALVGAVSVTADEAMRDEIPGGYLPEESDEFHLGYDAAIKRVRAALAAFGGSHD